MFICLTPKHANGIVAKKKQHKEHNEAKTKFDEKETDVDCLLDISNSS